MSRIVPKDKAAPEKKYDERPALQLLPEDNSEVLEAIASLTKSMETVSALVKAGVMGQSLNVKQVLDSIAGTHKRLSEQLALPKKLRTWAFKVKRDQFGEIDVIEAREVEQ